MFYEKAIQHVLLQSADWKGIPSKRCILFLHFQDLSERLVPAVKYNWPEPKATELGRGNVHLIVGAEQQIAWDFYCTLCFHLIGFVFQIKPALPA